MEVSGAVTSLAHSFACRGLYMYIIIQISRILPGFQIHIAFGVRIVHLTGPGALEWLVFMNQHGVVLQVVL